MSEEIKKYENITKVITDNKTLALVCPKCFNIVGACKQEFRVDFTRKEEPAKFYGHSINIQVDGFCDECGEYIEEFLTIDGDIAATISLLNQKGWKTLFSCAGHGNSTSAYIYFKSNKYLQYIMANFLPKGWKIDVDDYILKRDFIIRSTYNHYDIYELYEWANKLPILPDISKITKLPDDELLKIILNFPEEQLEFNDDKTKE